MDLFLDKLFAVGYRAASLLLGVDPVLYALEASLLLACFAFNGLPDDILADRANEIVRRLRVVQERLTQHKI